MKGATGVHDIVEPPLVDAPGSTFDSIASDRITIGAVKRCLIAMAGMPSWYMTAHSRGNGVWLFVRQIAMALSVEMTGRSTTYVGQSFGGRDHTTVIHARRRVAEITSVDAAALAFVEAARAAVRAGSFVPYTLPILSAQVDKTPTVEATYFSGRVGIGGTNLVVDGVVTHMMTRHAKIVGALLSARDRPIRYDDLCDSAALSGQRPLGECISRIRRRLEQSNVPLTIHTIAGVGYAMTCTGDAPVSDEPVAAVRPRLYGAKVDLVDPRIARLRREGWSVKSIARHLEMDAAAVARQLRIEWAGVAA